MEGFIVLLAAIAPALVLIYYIYRKDKFQPEPPKWLIKGFIYGILSAFLSFCFSIPLSVILEPILAVIGSDVLSALCDALFQAAIPEELAKLIMLWLLLRKNPYFDEHVDGVVYAVAISMGFAGFENILYLFDNYDSWVTTGVVRAVISVPGHFAFAVLMGYYYSLVCFKCKSEDKARNCILVLAAPVFAHFLFDAILMVSEVSEYFSVFLTIGFFYFLHKLHSRCRTRIAELLAMDRSSSTDACLTSDNH